MNASRSQTIRAALVSLALAVLSFSSLFTFITLRAHSVQKAAEASLGRKPRKIAYLTATTEALGNLDRAAFVAEGATLIGEEVNLKALDAQVPFEVLIFDSSTQTHLDIAWLQKRYAQGLIVVGINVTVIELANLVGDKTVVREQAPWQDAAFQPAGPYYASLYSLVEGVNPAEVQFYLTRLLTYTAEAGSVDADPSINSQLNVSRGSSQTHLDEQSIKVLFINLRGEIDSIRSTKATVQFQPEP